jgi:acetoin utilization deacetylase AcuC-like enzyme
MLSLLVGASAHLHDPGAGHPEARARVDRLCKCLLEAGYLLKPCNREATRKDLVTVHDPEYVDRVIALRGVVASLDPETRLGPDSVKAALNAAGTALAMADEIVGHQESQIFAIVRPPGHHAEPSSTSGYCVFNNVAIAAERLRRQGLRVCILDWDVHHGNGTERIFLARPAVLFVSIHSNRLFPQDSGDATTVGDGDGRGATVNVPLPSGAKLAAYAHATKTVILPVVRRFRPDVVLVSLGFDACEGDPQGNMRLNTEDFEFIGAAITAAAQGSAQGRIGMLLEGGYNIDAIGPCALAVLRGLRKGLDDWKPDQPTAEELIQIEIAARIQEGVLAHVEPGTVLAVGPTDGNSNKQSGL